MQLLLIIGLIHFRMKRITNWGIVFSLVTLSNMLFGSILTLRLVDDGYETFVLLMAIWELILGILATYLVEKYHEKLIGYVPLTILGEVLGIAIIAAYSFTGTISFVFVGNSLITLIAQIRIVFLAPALREVAKEERFDDQVAYDTIYLIIYLIAMGMSLYYARTSLLLAAIIAGVMRILASLLLRRLSYPKLTDEEKQATEKKAKNDATSLLIIGGTGVTFTLQCVIALRSMVSENDVVTSAFFTVFYISSSFSLLVAYWIKRDRRRILPILVASRIAAPLLWITMWLALVMGGWWSWGMVFLLYFITLEHTGPFRKLVHANADNKVLAQAKLQRNWLVMGLIGNTLFFIVFAWLRDWLAWIVLGLTIPTSISIVMLVMNWSQHIIRDSENKATKEQEDQTGPQDPLEE